EIFQAAVVGQYASATVPLGANRKPLWWILAQVADRLGLDVLPGGLDTHRASTDDVLAVMAGAARRPFEEVRDADGPVLAEGNAVFGWVLDGAVLPSGRWRVAPALLVEQLHNVVHEHQSLVLIPPRERRQI